MRKISGILLFCVMLLIAVGVVLLSSAGVVKAQDWFNDPLHFIKNQVLWIVVSFVVFFVTVKIDYRIWKRKPVLTYLALGVVVILLTLVLPIPGNPFSRSVNGSHRWLFVAGRALGQPSELAKVIVIFGLAFWLDRLGSGIRRFPRLLFVCGVLGVLAGQLLAEPDFGATVVLGCVAGAMLFVAGARFWHLGALALTGAGGVLALLATNENRMERLKGYFEGQETAGKTVSASYHQLQQSILSFKNGGPWGVGYNNSIQRYNYLPEAHTDFIFAIGGEEFGIFFSLSVLLIFFVFCVCGFLISFRCQERFGRLVAFGLTFLLVFQALFNIGVVTGCLPTKGIALPFISYGGTNLVVAMIAVGTLLNIARHVEEMEGTVKTQLAKNAVTEM